MKLCLHCDRRRSAAAAPRLPTSSRVPLKNTPGHEAVENNCAACHSLDYPAINSRIPRPQGMAGRGRQDDQGYGADIAPQDAAAIVDYLTKNYGSGS